MILKSKYILICQSFYSWAYSNVMQGCNMLFFYELFQAFIYISNMASVMIGGLYSKE